MTTILAQVVASYRTRATAISPGHALHAPQSGCAYGCPGDGSEVSPQSQCARFNQDAVEIAARLQIRHQGTHRRNRMTERAERALEISRTAGFDRRRRTGRERWCVAHLVRTAFFGSKAETRETCRVNQVPQTPPFSPSLYNQFLL